MTITIVTLVASAAILVFASYKYIFHPLFLCPLSRIPNAHFTSSISPAWIMWTRFRERNNVSTYNAHLQHGPVVRLAPNEISINCVDDGIRSVYAGGMEKHRWYMDQFESYGVTNMFTTVGHQPHSARKRMMSHVYSKSFLQTSSQIARNSVLLFRDRFLPQLDQAAQHGMGIEVHDMNNGFTMDFMSAYLFGIEGSTKFSVDSDTRQAFLQSYHGRRPYEFYSQEVPGLKKFTKRLGLPIVPKFVDDANEQIEEWVMKMCDGADSYLSAVPCAGAEPVVYKQLKTSLEKSQTKSPETHSRDRTRLEIASEMLDHLGAGHETTAIALTYLYWEMSQDLELQRRLRDELLSLEPQITWPPKSAAPFELPTPKSIDSLPLLHSIIMETLRLHAPIPGIEPRITPAGGCTLGGYPDIPANVRVSAMAYALHRNEHVFPEPERWKVERWFQPKDSAEMKEMLRWFWAFGSGGRMCIGSNLAMQEMKLMVAAVYSNYQTSIVDDTGIEAIDAYATRPRSNRLSLRFERA